MKKLYVIIFAALLASCNSSPKKEDKQNEAASKKSFNSFLDEYYEQRLQLYPLDATVSGDNRYNDLLPNDISEAYRAKLKSFYSTYQTELKSYNRDSLSVQEQVSYDVFTREMDINLRGFEFHDNYMP